MRQGLLRPALVLAAILAAPMAAQAQAQAQAPASGQYRALTLAVRGDEVRGVFSEGRLGNGSEAAPQFTCWFLLRGKLQNGRGIVETWYPGEAPIPGNLSFEGGGVSLMLREDHGGCPMTTGSMTEQPYRADLDRRAESPGEAWLDVALVQADRAVFRASPGAPAPRTPYVVQGDPVAVLERRGAWVRARYSAGPRPVTGWLAAADLALAGERSPERR